MIHEMFCYTIIKVFHLYDVFKHISKTNNQTHIKDQKILCPAFIDMDQGILRARIRNIFLIEKFT